LQQAVENTAILRGRLALDPSLRRRYDSRSDNDGVTYEFVRYYGTNKTTIMPLTNHGPDSDTLENEHVNEATVNAMPCARDHSWKVVKDSMTRGDCNCQNQLFIITDEHDEDGLQGLGWLSGAYQHKTHPVHSASPRNPIDGRHNRHNLNLDLDLDRNHDPIPIDDTDGGMITNYVKLEMDLYPIPHIYADMLGDDFC
jgi:hypothetical protein